MLPEQYLHVVVICALGKVVVPRWRIRWVGRYFYSVFLAGALRQLVVV